MIPYESLLFFTSLYIFQWVLMGSYRFICVFMGSHGSLLVLNCSHVVSVLMGPYKSSWVFIASNGFLWVIMSLFTCALLGTSSWL